MPSHETASDVAGRSTRETAVAETRSETTQALGAKPGQVESREQTNCELRKLAEQFNTVLRKPTDQLTKSDGWDMVANLLTFLTWNTNRLSADSDLVSELYKKTLVFFGSKNFLTASGMNAESGYRDGFLSTLNALEYKAKRALAQNTIDPTKDQNQWTEPLAQL
jgi:hypothetical protein